MSAYQDNHKDVQTVRWILNCSVGDVNYKNNLPKLSNEDLLYCIEHEKRPSSQSNLRREAKKREMSLVETPAGIIASIPSRDPDYPGVYVYYGDSVLALVEYSGMNGQVQSHLWKQHCDCDPVITLPIQNCDICDAANEEEA